MGDRCALTTIDWSSPFHTTFSEQKSRLNETSQDPTSGALRRVVGELDCRCGENPTGVSVRRSQQSQDSVLY